MWRSVTKATQGVLCGLDNVVTQLQALRPALFLDFSGQTELLMVSDYGGQHSEARYEAYTFVLTTRRWWASWERERRAVRGTFLLTRRFSFKNLNDDKRWEALPAMLSAASRLPGVSFTVLVNRCIKTLFSTTGALDMKRPELARIDRKSTRL